jgi:hypothetical protein
MKVEERTRLDVLAAALERAVQRARRQLAGSVIYQERSGPKHPKMIGRKLARRRKRPKKAA